MKFKFASIEGGVVAPKGFKTSGVFCDIKRLGTGKGSDKGQKRDLALILSEKAAACAGMFTTNQVCAAPVKLCIERVKNGNAMGVVVNSGNANACTGRQGMKDALEMVSFAERALAVPPGSMLAGSTGRIGVVMPMGSVRAGIVEAVTELGSTPEHAAAAAEAIMTSDTKAKQCAVEWSSEGVKLRLGGMCKGAGMIQPGMSANGQRPAAAALHATMLCFLTTDAAVSPRALQEALQQAVAHSFNSITIDGDMSTNDTVLLLANGMAADTKAITSKKSAGFEAFASALNFVCLELAKMIVRDGEGVTRFVTIRVEGARTAADADMAARAVANSALVKTSWFGGDPNWGRIIDALGYSPAKIIEERVDIGYSRSGSKKVVWSLRKGQPTAASFKELCAEVALKEFDLRIRLNSGDGSAVMYAADLTEEYVDFNKGNVADPSSLGG